MGHFALYFRGKSLKYLEDKMEMTTVYLHVICIIGIASNVYVSAQCFEAGKYDGNMKKNGGINIDVATISNVEDPESCQKECQKDPACKFWTYSNEFAKWRPGRKKCW